MTGRPELSYGGGALPLRRTVLATVIALSMGGCDREARDSEQISLAPTMYEASLAEPIAAEPILPPMTQLWSLGDTASGSPEQDFGRIIGATFGASGRIYLLDAAAQRIRVLDSTGIVLHTIGRAGQQRGELVDPRALALGARDTLLVADFVNGIVRYEIRGDEWAPLGTIALDFPPTDVCSWDDGFVVFGHHEGNVLHHIDDYGTVRSSTGGLFGPVEHPVRGILSLEGKLACYPELGLAVVISRLLPEMRAFRVANGEQVWSASLPSYTQVNIELEPTGFPAGSYTMSQPEGGASQNEVLEPISDTLLLVQARRTPRDTPTEAVVSCIVEVAEGRCIRQYDNLPLLLAVQANMLVAVRHTHHPIVQFLSIDGWP